MWAISELLHKLFHYWMVDLMVSFINFTILMNIYEPMWGEPMSHQVGMSIRIIYIFIIAAMMVRSMKRHSMSDLVKIGFIWITLWLIFEWGGSLLIGRPVAEILVGWNIFRGYMWPYVLLAYLLACPVIGLITKSVYE